MVFSVRSVIFFAVLLAAFFSSCGREKQPAQPDDATLHAQERRLENDWIFGEWQDSHGARLIFRDDGSVSVGARGGTYDELGEYRFISPEEPSFEAVWTLFYDEAGQPVVEIPRPDGSHFIYPFHQSRKEVYERVGDLLESAETGFNFKKNQ